MSTVTTSNTMENIYPIYASEMQRKWQYIKQEMLEACEYDIDKWDINYCLSSLAFEEDDTFKVINLSDKKFNIDWFKSHHLELFKKVFDKILPNYSFRFKEIK